MLRTAAGGTAGNSIISREGNRYAAGGRNSHIPGSGRVVAQNSAPNRSACSTRSVSAISVNPAAELVIGALMECGGSGRGARDLHGPALAERYMADILQRFQLSPVA